MTFTLDVFNSGTNPVHDVITRVKFNSLSVDASCLDMNSSIAETKAGITYPSPIVVAPVASCNGFFGVPLKMTADVDPVPGETDTEQLHDVPGRIPLGAAARGPTRYGVGGAGGARSRHRADRDRGGRGRGAAVGGGAGPGGGAARLRIAQRTVLGEGGRDLVAHAADLEAGFRGLRDYVEDVGHRIDARLTDAERRLDGAVAHRRSSLRRL